MSINLSLPQESVLAILRWYDAYLDKVASNTFAFKDSDYEFNKEVKDVLYDVVKEKQFSNIIEPVAMKVLLIKWLQSDHFLGGIWKDEMKDVDFDLIIKTPKQQQGEQFPNDLLFNYDGGVFYDLFSYRSNAVPEALEQLGDYLNRYKYTFDHNLSWQMAISKDLNL